MFLMTLMVVAAITTVPGEFLQACNEEYAMQGGEGEAPIFASGKCTAFQRDIEPLVNFCDQDRGKLEVKPLAEILKIAAKGAEEVQATERQASWAAWQAPDKTVVVCIEGLVGEYEKSLVWSIKDDCGKSQYGWTAWGYAQDGEPEYTIITLGGASSTKEAKKKIKVLEELGILKYLPPE